MITAAAPMSWIRRAASRASSIDAMRRPLSASASGMFGVTTRARGSSSRAERAHAVLVEQAVAARRHQHRIDDDQRQLQLGDRRGHRLDDRGVGEHADLGGVRSSMSPATASICAVTRSAGSANVAVDADGALRGDAVIALVP